MITLALDTSTNRGAVALLRDTQLLGEQSFGRQRLPEGVTATDLFSSIRVLLDVHQITPSQIGLLAVGLGPGSFTGIRAGIAAVKGLALPNSLPAKGIGSFDALALTAARHIPPDCPQLCVLADARRDQVYYAMYDHQGRPTAPVRLTELEAIADEIHHPIWFVSSEIEKFSDDLRAAFGGFASVADQSIYPSAAALGWLAVDRYHTAGDHGDQSLEPIYLRETDYKKAI